MIIIKIYIIINLDLTISIIITKLKRNRILNLISPLLSNPINLIIINFKIKRHLKTITKDLIHQ